MRIFGYTALAAGLLMAGAGAASAQETIRLGGPTAATEADTDLVRGYHGGHYHGHWHGGYGHRGYYAHYRPYYYASYYWPYYRPYVYIGTPSYYYSTPYYYSSAYYYPIADNGTPPPAQTLQGTSNFQAPPPAPLPNGTYPYDGGPRIPIPMPPPSPGSDVNPARGVPLDGKLVSLPAANSPPAQKTTPRIAYPAYGE